MFADVIRTLRQQKGVSQYQLAASVGVAQPTVAKWEKGKANPDTETLTRLIGYFGVTADCFLGNAPLKDVFTEDEIRLVEAYRRLSSSRKQLVKELVSQLSCGAASVIQSNYQNTGGTNVVNVNGKQE